MPKVITGNCGHRCESMYVRSRVEGAKRFKSTKYSYCPICDKVYIMNESTDFYERFVRINVRQEDGAIRGPFVIPVPRKIKLKVKSDIHGVYTYSEAQFSMLKRKIERLWQHKVREVKIVTDLKGKDVEYRLIMNDIPRIPSDWDNGAELHIDNYEHLENMTKYIRIFDGKEQPGYE